MMVSSFRTTLLVLLVTLQLCGITREGYARLLPGQSAPLFLLNDIRGKQIDFSKSGKRLVMLYFFDVDSRPSLEGLNALNKLSQKYRSELAVYAISYSAPERIAQYVQHNAISFPVLHDAAHVRDLYHAKQILPVGCLVGPGLKVVAYYQGGGNSMEVAMSKDINHELQNTTRTHSPPAGATVNSTTLAPKLLKSPAAELAEQTPRNPPAHAESGGTQGKVGRIINDNEW